MKRKIRFLVLLCSPLLMISVFVQSQVPQILFDTDFGSDSDDMGALAMLHNLENGGECKLLGILCWNTEKYAVPAIDAVNRYYGNGEIPVGVRKEGSREIDWNYSKVISQNLPHELTQELAEDATLLYRKILEQAEDSSIVLLTVGPLKNIQNLINSQADTISPYSGEELISQKVKEMVIMGGEFPEGDGEWNFGGDMPGVTKFVLEHITVPITFSGFEVGFQIKTGEVFNGIDTLSPLYLGYQHWSARLPGYKGEVLDNETYDQTAVLYAVRGGIDRYWSRVDGGYCEAGEFGGKNRWIQGEPSNHSYLKLIEDPERMSSIIESIMLNTF